MTTVQEVLDAARDGDSNFWTRSFEALQGRFDVHMAADDGMTSTLLAARNGHLKLLEFILANGGNPNDCEHYGGTCLMAAACFAHPECVRALVKAGADVTYAYAGDNANCVYMLALCFTGNLTEDAYSMEASLQEHSAPWVRTLDLLLGYGAAPDQPSQNRALAAARDACRRGHAKDARGAREPHRAVAQQVLGATPAAADARDRARGASAPPHR